MGVQNVFVNGLQFKRLLLSRDISRVVVCEGIKEAGLFNLSGVSEKDACSYVLTVGDSSKLRTWKHLGNVSSYLSRLGVNQFSVRMVARQADNSKLKKSIGVKQQGEEGNG